MYEGFYGFRERAFRKTPDPRFLFLSEAYEEALEQLLFAVEEMELALLTGGMRPTSRSARAAGSTRASSAAFSASAACRLSGGA